MVLLLLFLSPEGEGKRLLGHLGLLPPQDSL